MVARKEPRPEHIKRKIAETLANMWEVTTPTGETLIITNLRQFCLEHHLNQGNFSTYGHTKGYRAAKIE